MRISFLLIAIIVGTDVFARNIEIINVRILDNHNAFQNPAKNPYIIPIQNEINLNYDQNSFVVHFSYMPEHKIIYQLKSFNDSWFETTDNHILFTALPNGQFELIMKDAGKPDSQPARLKINIQSPIWLRWWFLPLMFFYALVLVSILLYFLFQYRLRQQIRTQFIRDNIARDLHDDMGSYLSSISILSQNVERMLEDNPEKAHSSLKKIGETARHVMDTMGDIVWSVNPNYDSMEQIINRMRDFSNELFFNRDVMINIEGSEAVRKVNLSLEKKRDFFLIFKEALTNIYKYAEATIITVQLQFISGQIRMSIEDNGKGFDVEDLPKTRITGGNGLKNMKVRTQKLNGHLRITSQAGMGSKVLLEFEL